MVLQCAFVGCFFITQAVLTGQHTKPLVADEHPSQTGEWVVGLASVAVLMKQPLMGNYHTKLMV